MAEEELYDCDCPRDANGKKVCACLDFTFSRSVESLIEESRGREYQYVEESPPKEGEGEE
jgi:hypothetical protein